MHVCRFTTIQPLARKQTQKGLTDLFWLKFTCNISAQSSCNLLFFCKTMDATVEYTAEDSEMLETFKLMGPLLKMDCYERPEDDRGHKKAKKANSTKAEHNADASILQAMGQLLLKLDAEQQAWKRQDSWICFMQTEPQAILPSLIQTAATWKQKLQVKQEPMQDLPVTPLRCVLTQHLAEILQQRLQRLAANNDKDPLKGAALEHGMLTPEGGFPFQRWSAPQQALRSTTQTPIPIQRMVRYADQLREILKDPQVTVKFHSLRPLSAEKVVPWMWQISMRADDLQVLLSTLQGSTVWGLLGMSVKPHTLHQSKQGMHLQSLMGKGAGKHHGKHQGKSKTPTS